MPGDAEIKKGEGRFAEECKRLLDICDEIGTKGDKNMQNVRLNHA